jgi:hypothetical protein
MAEEWLEQGFAVEERILDKKHDCSSSQREDTGRLLGQR